MQSSPTAYGLAARGLQPDLIGAILVAGVEIELKPHRLDRTRKGQSLRRFAAARTWRKDESEYRPQTARFGAGDVALSESRHLKFQFLIPRRQFIVSPALSQGLLAQPIFLFCAR